MRSSRLLRRNSLHRNVLRHRDEAFGIGTVARSRNSVNEKNRARLNVRGASHNDRRSIGNEQPQVSLRVGVERVVNALEQLRMHIRTVHALNAHGNGDILSGHRARVLSLCHRDGRPHLSDCRERRLQSDCDDGECCKILHGLSIRELPAPERPNLLHGEVIPPLSLQRGRAPVAKHITVRLTRFSLHNPIAVTLFYLLVGVIGLAALVRMGRSILPPVSFPIVSIAAPYPGASPTEMERLIVEPVEDQLASAPGVERVSSTAQDGIAEIVVRFRFGTDLEADRAAVRDAVDAARPNMPADLVPPVVSKTDPSQSAVLEESIGSALLQPGTLSELVDRQIAPALRNTPGIGNVLVSGEAKRQFTIVPNTGRLNALGGTALDLERAIAANNDVLPGGSFKSPIADTSIGISAAATSSAQLRDVPITIPGSRNVRVGDVASVADDYAEQTVVTRVDGDPAIVLGIVPAPNVDSIAAIRSAQRTFAKLSQRFPLARFQELRTDAPYTSAAVAGVLQTLAEGIALTVAVMLLFLRAWRNAAIAAISIPTSLCAAFATMWILGFTVNVLSLMGLSLTIGILVDDSIVILEAIARAARRGLRGPDAAMAGRSELGSAAFAITLVDVAVFAPIGFMSGIVGEFMREFALVIVIATAFSLLVSFTLTPLLAGAWALKERPILRLVDLPWTFRTRLARAIGSAWHHSLAAFNACEERLSTQYAQRWLPAALQKRRLVIAVAVALSVAALVPLFAGAIATEFSPPVNRGTETVDVMLPAGTPLQRTDAAVTLLSDALLRDSDVKHVVAWAGRGFNGSTDVAATSIGQLSVVLVNTSASGDTIRDRIKRLSTLAPDARIVGSGRGMGGTAPVSYSVAGDDDAIDAAARRIENVLRSNPYATDIRSTNGGMRPRLQITIDPAKSALLGVSPGDAAQTARIATGGAIATKVRLPSGLFDVVIRSRAAETGDIDAIRRMTVRSSDTATIPLGDLADITQQQEPGIIQREDGHRVVAVTANTVDSAPIGLVSGDVGRKLRDPNFLPPGAHVEPRGDLEQFLDTLAKITAALALAVIAVYAILAILYRNYVLPLVIMATVPLASVGAFGSLYVFHQPLNLYSMLGIVMLVGLVAKNGILLVEYAERAVRDNVPAMPAVCDAARIRFRPIVMTTAAMIAGMLPLALGHTIGAEYRQALGTVVIGGLSSSLLLTLFVVPAAYVAYRGRSVAQPPAISELRIRTPQKA